MSETKREQYIRKLSGLDDFGAHISGAACAEVVELLKDEDKWIPCSERLPEETGIYLCTVGDPYRNPREMRYAPQEWADEIANATWRNTDGYYVFDWFVKAWMPLPEPWKGADECSSK